MKPILLSSVFLIALCGELLSAPLEVGDPVPATTLRTESGDAVQLTDLVQTQPAVVIFYRGGWCPYCTRHLSALMEIEKDILAAGHQILAISPDQPSKIAETPDRESLGYTLLSDSSMETAKAFGITFQVPAELVSKYKNEYQIDLEAASGQTHHLLPHPAVYVIGTDGIIRFVHVNEDYKVRLEPAEILEAVKGG
jgi:peroxiredoxin